MPFTVSMTSLGQLHFTNQLYSVKVQYAASRQHRHHQRSQQHDSLVYSSPYEQRESGTYNIMSTAGYTTGSESDAV